MTNHPASLLSLLTLASLAAGQHPVNAPPPVLIDSLAVTTTTVQSLLLPPADVQSARIAVTLAGAPRMLRLDRFDVRSRDFRLLVDDGGGLHELPAPDAVTYRGSIEGDADSAVAATIIGGRLRALVRTADQDWVIQPTTDLDPGLPDQAHAVYRCADVRSASGSCGSQALTSPTLPFGAPGTAAATGVKVAEIAIDIDEPYYRLLGSSTTAVHDDVTAMLNAVDLIYRRDVLIEHRITAVVIRTSATYSTNDPSGLLGEMRSRWNGNHGGIRRDVAHLFTARPRTTGTIGLAFVGVVCHTDWAYGLSWSRFSSNWAHRIALVAHELGHNWAASHCDGASPCNIMCSRIASCSSGVGSLAPASVTAITNFRRSRPCLDAGPATRPPSLSAITPSSIPSHIANQVVLTGTDLDTVGQLSVGGTNVPFTIVDATSIRFTPPSPFAIGTHQVVAINSAGTSNGLPLGITASHPAVLVAPTFMLRGIPLPLTVYSDAGWRAVVLASGSNAPSSAPGVLSLAIGAGFTNLAPIAVLDADPRGVSTSALTIPASVVPSSLYLQAVVFDPAVARTPLEVSNVATGSVF